MTTPETITAVVVRVDCEAEMEEESTRGGERARGGVKERRRATILHEISQAECFVFSPPSFITVVKHQKARRA